MKTVFRQCLCNYITFRTDQMCFDFESLGDIGQRDRAGQPHSRIKQAGLDGTEEK